MLNLHFNLIPIVYFRFRLHGMYLLQKKEYRVNNFMMVWFVICEKKLIVHKIDFKSFFISNSLTSNYSRLEKKHALAIDVQKLSKNFKHLENFWKHN